MGVSRGDRVILHLPNSLEWVVAYHGIARLGAVVIPANILLSPTELTYMAEDTHAVAAILSQEKATVDVGPARKIVPGGAENMLRFEDLFEEDWLEPVDVDGDDLFKIAYTSGTNGKPKGAMLTHGHIFASVPMHATNPVRHAHDRVFSRSPSPHVSRTHLN